MSGAAPAWLTARPIAHRGLHDLAAGRPENSLSSFRAAIAGGYAIECDLQPSGDGVPMVFHDVELRRLTGELGATTDLDAATLGRLALLDSDERVPTLSQLLELVADRVPIVLELKGPQRDARAFVDAVARVVADYSGRLAVMSFDHEIVSASARAMPDRPRGLTAMGGDGEFETHRRIYEAADLGFVSYHVDALPSRFVNSVRKRGHPAITWTVRTAEQVHLTRVHADQMTFEGFLPDG